MIMDFRSSFNIRNCYMILWQFQKTILRSCSLNDAEYNSKHNNVHHISIVTQDRLGAHHFYYNINYGTYRSHYNISYDTYHSNYNISYDTYHSYYNISYDIYHSYYNMSYDTYHSYYNMNYDTYHSYYNMSYDTYHSYYNMSYDTPLLLQHELWHIPLLLQHELWHIPLLLQHRLWQWSLSPGCRQPWLLDRPKVCRPSRHKITKIKNKNKQYLVLLIISSMTSCHHSKFYDILS